MNTRPASNVFRCAVPLAAMARTRRGQKSRMIPRSNQRCPATTDDGPGIPSKQRVTGGPQASHGTATSEMCGGEDAAWDRSVRACTARVYVRLYTNAEPFILAVKLRRTSASDGEGPNGYRGGGRRDCRYVADLEAPGSSFSVFTVEVASRAYGTRGGSSRRRMVFRDDVETPSIRQSSIALPVLWMSARMSSERTRNSVR